MEVRYWKRFLQMKSLYAGVACNFSKLNPLAYVNKLSLNVYSRSNQTFRHNPRISLEDPELVESFTISLGSQVKSTHNLRLLVSDMDDLFKSPNDEVRDMAYRAQTTADLYSQNLTAV